MEVVLLIALVLAGLWWYGRRSGAVGNSKGQELVASTDADDPDGHEGGLARRQVGRLVRLSCDGRVPVVGESNYQPALKAAAGGQEVAEGAFDDAVPVTATLHPEPRNRYDSNAVRVDVDGRTVGYLARGIAAEYQRPLLGLDGIGWCHARIMGGGRNRSYGIFLLLAEPGRIVFGNSCEGVEILDADRNTTVTGEEKHQHVLEQLPGESQDGSFPPLVATFAVSEVSKGKYAGEPCIEVRIDGHRVGELTRRMSERYLPTVEEVIGRGETPGCETYVRRTDGKGIQVELRMPKPVDSPA